MKIKWHNENSPISSLPETEYLSNNSRWSVLYKENKGTNTEH